MVAGRTGGGSSRSGPVEARDEESKLDGRRSTGRSVGRKRRNVSVEVSGANGFDTSMSGSNALFSGFVSSEDEEGEPEVMMKKKGGKGERKGESGSAGCSRGKTKDLVFISDDEEEEEEVEEGSSGENEKTGSFSESETEDDYGVRMLASGDDSVSSEGDLSEGKRKMKGKKKVSGSSEQKETGSESTKKQQRKNEGGKNEKEKKSKEKVTNSESSHMKEPTKTRREKDEACKKRDKGKQNQIESETAKLGGKQKQTDSVSVKRKGKAKRTASESVKTGWDSCILKNGLRDKKRQRKQNPPVSCVAWRTRSFNDRDPQRFNYTQFFSNRANVNSDDGVVGLGSDSADSDSQSRLKTIAEEEEDESSSDSEYYTVSDEYSDSESDSDSSELKEETGKRSEGKSSYRERKKYLKSERRRKRKWRHERGRKYEKERSSEILFSSECDERDLLMNGLSSDGSSMDEIPLTERPKMKLAKMHVKKRALEKKESKKRAREMKERKKYKTGDTENSEERKERKRRVKERKQRKSNMARDNGKRDMQETENSGSKKKERRNKNRNKNRNRKRRENMAGRDDLMEYIMNNMNEEDNEEMSEVTEPWELPMLFRWDASDDEPNKSEDPHKELWDHYNFAIRSENLCTYDADGAQEGPGKRESNEEFYKGLNDYCENGAHEMFLDEEIGYRCALCSYVQTEIRYVMPGFAKNANGRNVPKKPTDINDLLNSDMHSVSQNPDEPGLSCTNTGTVWDLIPGIYHTLYPHQQEAFEFMWRNLAGSIQMDELSNKAYEPDDQVGGCVVSHAPGTGKTRLAIIFIQSYMKLFPNANPVVIAPAGMMLTWENEFRKWGFAFPFHNMNSEDYTGKEDQKILQLTRGEPRSMGLARKIKLSSWVKGKCVLGISYSLFNKYISHISKSGSKERGILIEQPGLLILDEGHIPRNDRSHIWNAFNEVKTDKRIILSGTPFQNSFSELYNSLCIIRPKFAQKIDVQPKKKNKEKEKKIKDVWATATENITPEIVEQARRILMPFVHVHAGSILQSLPGLRECVIMLRPEKMQSETLINFNKLKKTSGTFDADHKASLASVHPSLLAFVSNLTEIEKETLNVPMLETLKNDPYEGVKTKFVVEFLRLCDSLKERVLIFSQYLEPLKMIKKQLMTVFNWMEGDEILQIYGRIHFNLRQDVINKFNDLKSDARVLLASTKACSEGISLTGASRVVLLDVVWNPSVGKQAISRAFRIGQEKVVYTYNLMTTGSGDMEKFDVQGRKEELSKLVFSPKCEASKSKKEGFVMGWNEKDGEACKMVSDDQVLEGLTESEKLKEIFENIYYIMPDEFHD